MGVAPSEGRLAREERETGQEEEERRRRRKEPHPATHHPLLLPLSSFPCCFASRPPRGRAAMADSNLDSIKRYTPPVHRNRANNRRKAGDRAEKANYSYNNDGEKSHVPSLKNFPPIIPHDAFVSNAQNGYSQARLVPLEGCSASEAAQLLSDRWAAAMNLYNDPNDSPGKPVMYNGSSGSSWGQSHLKLPHQMNFLEDLRRAVDAQTGLASGFDTRN